MDTLEARFTRYMQQVTGEPATLRPMPGLSLPYHLKRQYAVCTVYLAPLTLVAVLVLDPSQFTPGNFRKHLPQLVGKQPAMACLVAEELPGYVRRRLMEAGQAFVVPGVQMYLPMLGLEWRKRAAHKPARIGDGFTPATQLLFFYLLQGKGRGETALSLCRALGYSAMSMSRAIKALELAGIVAVAKAGRERKVELAGPTRAMWQRALPFLRSPVIDEIRLPQSVLAGAQLPLAGESALAAATALAKPPVPYYATGRPWWKIQQLAGVEPIPVDEPGTCMVQLWSYDPELLGSGTVVDPFSLYASLEDDPDERIEQALAKLMELYL